MTSNPWASVLSPDRTGRTRAGLVDARARFDAWFAARRDDPRFARFDVHLRALSSVLERMLEAIADSLPARDDDSGDGLTYEQCRRADAQIALVLRLHTWYAAKYDQRTDPLLEQVLLAADEVIRSCWTQPFTVARHDPPTGPLAYLEPRYDAYATPRVSVPADLRAAGDAVLAEFVSKLPIPVVALPELVTREPWWLIVAAHETGHHVQQDLSPGLVGATRTALLAVTEEATALLAAPEKATAGDESGADLTGDWQRWSIEAFADAFAALSCGSAASWAVEELQHGAPARLTAAPRPGDRYPPPLVRTALMGELARLAGDARPGPGAEESRAWLDALPEGIVHPAVRSVLRHHLDLTPRVSAALAELRTDGRSLRELCGTNATRFAERGDVSGWCDVLTGGRPEIGRTRREAARLAVAAGVHAYLTAARTGQEVTGLRAAVLDLLPRCGPAGVLAGELALDVEPIATGLAARLLEVDPDADPPRSES